MHPLVNKIRDDYGADIQHGTILEDFSVLNNCTNLVLDFSTFGYTAALMNTNLKSVFISKFVDKNGVSLLNDINGDIGFTMPEIESRCFSLKDALLGVVDWILKLMNSIYPKNHLLG